MDISTIHRQDIQPVRISLHRQSQPTGSVQGRSVTLGGKPLTVSITAQHPVDSMQRSVTTKPSSRLSRIGEAVEKVFTRLFRTTNTQSAQESPAIDSSQDAFLSLMTKVDADDFKEEAQDLLTKLQTEAPSIPLTEKQQASKARVIEDLETLLSLRQVESSGKELAPDKFQLDIKMAIGELVTTERKFQEDMSALADQSDGPSLLSRLKEISSSKKDRATIEQFEKAVSSLTAKGPQIERLLEKIEEHNENNTPQGVVDLLHSNYELIHTHLDQMGQCAALYSEFMAIDKKLYEGKADKYDAITEDLSKKTKGSSPRGDGQFSHTAIKTVQRGPRWSMLLGQIAKTLQSAPKDNSEELRNESSKIFILQRSVERKLQQIDEKTPKIK